MAKILNKKNGLIYNSLGIVKVKMPWTSEDSSNLTWIDGVLYESVTGEKFVRDVDTFFEKFELAKEENNE